MPPLFHPSALLKAKGVLNPHPELVKAPGFREDGFFDPRDLVQVRYEMLRYAHQEGATKSATAARFGVSRPTFYHLEAAFLHEGLSGLLPRPRGPKTGYKLTDAVMAFIKAAQHANPKAGARQLARCLHEEHGVSVHPRSIERALARKKNGLSRSSSSHRVRGHLRGPTHSRSRSCGPSASALRRDPQGPAPRLQPGDHHAHHGCRDRAGCAMFIPQCR